MSGPLATDLPVLTEPADGVPEVIVTERELQRCVAAVAAGQGPVALDAERASGYRYGQRAYLVQIRREQAGTWLIDPIALPDLSELNDAIGPAEWLLHAATQDLPCLAEVGLLPQQLFDTELAGRLLGLPRVGLATVVEHYLGVTLEKEHSAVDWSTRPLPESWQRYAALDVEVLGELRNLMGVDLATAGKDQWAREEFAALTKWTPPRRSDPWRRVPGVSRMRTPQLLAAAQQVWLARENAAQQRDIAPGRILPDRLIAPIVLSQASSAEQLPTGHRAIGRHADLWLDALALARNLPTEKLPQRATRSDGPPPARSWAEKNPLAAARLSDVRAALQAFSTLHEIPVENVCSPDPLRRVLWSPPTDPDSSSFADALAGHGVRCWQQQIVIPLLLDAWARHPDVPVT